MLYWVSFTINCTIGASPSITSLNAGDSLTTLMLLFQPATPKYACQIHKSCDVTTSSMIVGAALPWKIDLSMLLNNFSIPNSYNQSYLTYLKNHITQLFAVGIECHFYWVFLSIRLQIYGRHPLQTYPSILMSWFLQFDHNHQYYQHVVHMPICK